MTDLDELERLALEATAGPWTLIEDPHESPYGAQLATDHYVGSLFERDAAAYIVAASPDVILDLIARVRAAEGTVTLLSDEIRRKGLTSGSAMAAHLDVELEQLEQAKKGTKP